MGGGGGGVSEEIGAVDLEYNVAWLDIMPLLPIYLVK